VSDDSQRLTLIVEGAEIDIVLDALELFEDWFEEDEPECDEVGWIGEPDYDDEPDDFWPYDSNDIRTLRERIAREAGREEGGEPDAAGA